MEYFHQVDAKIHENASAEISDLLGGPLGVTELQIPAHEPLMRYSQRIENKSQKLSGAQNKLSWYFADTGVHWPIYRGGGGSGYQGMLL